MRCEGILTGVSLPFGWDRGLGLSGRPTVHRVVVLGHGLVRGAGKLVFNTKKQEGFTKGTK